MRNDEKIDINLPEKNREKLSAEEQVEQDYETALRYINIAEHMKQFEDQAKYYQRAIRYLKKVRPYKNVRPQIRALKKKKFAARAEGKIALYEEACRIRDKAKTPSDYYSAEMLFRRIHRYEERRNIVKRHVSPEVYEKVCRYSDSEQQAQYCADMSKAVADRQKRHSLFASGAVILVLVLLALFTQTTAFWRCLAFFFTTTGNETYAWKSYHHVYDATKEEDALEQYRAHRYTAALAEFSEGDTDDAYDDLLSLAKDDYQDSREQLLTLEQYLISETEPGEMVQYADMDWRVLSKEDGKALLIKDKAMGSTAFNESGGKCTWETSSIRAWLNDDFLSENFYACEAEAIAVTAVAAEDSALYGTSAGNDTSDQVFLLSSSEVEKYRDALHETQTCWWLRTPGASAGTMAFVYPDKTVMDYGYEVSNTEITAKPAIWVSLE